MKPILIVKLGSTMPSLAATHGDFEDWIEARGSSVRDPHHAYAVGRSTWCVQFHPEFDEATTKAYVDKCVDELRAQGDDPTQLRNSTSATPHAEALLRQFGTIAGDGDPADR